MLLNTLFIFRLKLYREENGKKKILMLKSKSLSMKKKFEKGLERITNTEFTVVLLHRSLACSDHVL